VPANAVAGLMAAAWVAASPPLRARLAGLEPAPAEAAAVVAAPSGTPLWAPPREDPPPLADVAGPGALPVAEADWRRRRPLPWSALAAAMLVLAFAAGAAWTAFQPVRSVHADDIAIGRLEDGQLEAASSIAQVARDRNPLSPEPLWELGYIEEQRGRLANAEAALQQAIEVQPASAEAWRRLGRLQLSTLNQPDDAVASFRAAYFLDPHNPQSTSDLLEATRAAAQPSP
jgi:tetratricopeptide (TPR) repeat protein